MNILSNYFIMNRIIKTTGCIMIMLTTVCEPMYCNAIETNNCIGEIHAQQSKIDGETMRCQADSFLRAMPSDLQHRQTLAILKAIDGDNSDLESVRNARNSAPSISDNVNKQMLASGLWLYEPKEENDSPLPLLIYLHGGGWTIGSPNSCGRFCNAMAASGKMKVIAVDYRLAPEHPFPAGLEDCTDAVKYAVSHATELGIDPERISVGGDSSGGNLAIATALEEECSGMVESLLLFYPVTKAYDDNSESWQSFGKGYGLDAEIMDAFNSAYTVNADPENLRISVGLCDAKKLGNLPRTLLIAAGRDILRDQGIEFAERVGSDRLTRVEFSEAVHLFITVPGQNKAFSTAVNMSTDFITQPTNCNKQ